MKVLITGGSGLIGSHLIDHILRLNTHVEIYAIKKPRTQSYRPESVKWIDCDITDYMSVMNTILSIQPNYIFHLAAQSYPKISETNPLLTVDTNIVGTVNILEALKFVHCDDLQRVIIACSAAAYGDVNGKYPTTEDTLFKPLSLYGVSKATQDLLGYQYWKNYNLPIVRIRPYIIVGSRQGENNAVNSFAKQIATIEKNGGKGIIKVGNLDSYRDMTDVRDCVSAIWELALLGEDGEAYNVCSNVPRKMSDVLNDLLDLSYANVDIEIDSNKLRPSDIPLEVGSYDKLYDRTGWRPKRKWKETLQSVLDYWRSIV